MKLGIVFIVLGILGIAQYAIFPFTTDFRITGDWTSGIVGAAIGIGLLIFGISRIRRAKHEKIR